MFIGYNLNRVSKATEPEFGLKVESNFLDADGYTKLEAYFQYKSVGGILARPIFTQINKTTERIKNVLINGGLDGFQVFGGVGNTTNDNQLLSVYQKSSDACVVVGDNASFPAGTSQKHFNVLGNSNADMVLATYGQSILTMIATDGGGTPSAQLYCKNYNTGVPFSLYINEPGGNVGIGTTAVGANANKALSIGVGTAPSTSPANVAQLWVADAAGADTACLHTRTEAGATIKWYQGAAVANPGAGEAEAKLIELLTILRAQGLIAT
jgi:hypothetical protein